MQNGHKIFFVIMKTSVLLSKNTTSAIRFSCLINPGSKKNTPFFSLSPFLTFFASYLCIVNNENSPLEILHEF